MNSNSDLARFRDRLINLQEEINAARDAVKDVGVEMKSAGLSKAEIRGVKLAVKRRFEDEEKREARESAEEIADALGAFASSDLGKAAVERAVA